MSACRVLRTTSTLGQADRRGPDWPKRILLCMPHNVKNVFINEIPGTKAENGNISQGTVVVQWWNRDPSARRPILDLSPPGLASSAELVCTPSGFSKACKVCEGREGKANESTLHTDSACIKHEANHRTLLYACATNTRACNWSITLFINWQQENKQHACVIGNCQDEEFNKSEKLIAVNFSFHLRNGQIVLHVLLSVSVHVKFQL